MSNSLTRTEAAAVLPAHLEDKRREYRSKS